MTSFAFGNLLLFGSMILSALGQVLLKRLMSTAGGKLDIWGDVLSLASPSRTLAAGGIFLVLLGGFMLWALSLARLDLSYAYPMACGSALIVVLFSAIFLGEAVSPRVYFGTILIVAGTALLAR